MKSVQFNFKGLISPVFTAFSADKKTVNYDLIDKYAAYLKGKGVQGVLVNGTTGEGTCLSLEERKRTAEEWQKACRKHQLVCMVQIGGAPIADVYELARHAEKTGVDACLCLPELFFRPTSEEDLVEYCREVAQYCPTRPFHYYHIPQFTKVELSMKRFCDLAEEQIPSFCGIKYTCGDLAAGSACLKQGRNVFLGADTILSGALVLGFDSAICTTLNICPEYSIQCLEAARNYKWQEVQAAQDKLTRRVQEITSKGTGDWVETMKAEFNKVNGHLNCGPHRKPTLNFNRKH